MLIPMGAGSAVPLSSTWDDVAALSTFQGWGSCLLRRKPAPVVRWLRCTNCHFGIPGWLLMYFHYVPYLWFLLASTVITTVLAVFAWRHRAVAGASPFAILMFLAALWALANGLEMAGTDLPTKLFWANVQYLSYVVIPVAWLALALQIGHQAEWLNRHNLALLLIVPMVIIVLVWSDSLHGLMRRNVYLDTAGPFPVISKTPGPWFWVNVAYGYALLMATLFLLLRIMWRAPSLYRRQAFTVMVSLLLPLTSSALYNFGLSPVPRHDISPAVFALSGLIVAWGLFRFRLFDIMPVARAQVVEGMEHGLIVLDGQDRVVDINPAARRLLGPKITDQALGQAAADAFASWPELAELVADPAVNRSEFSIGMASAGSTPYRTLSFRISSLTNWRHRHLGRVIILNDITRRKATEARLAQQQQALAVLEERERLARELHDSLGQVLGFVNVQAQATGALLAQGQIEQANTCLSRLAEVATNAQADVREYIAATRAATASADGVLPALESLLQQFRLRCGIETTFILQDSEKTLVFSPAVEVQLLRIVQEALSNIRKHARAHHVQVFITNQGDHAEVSLVDDGCGFDPTSHTAQGAGHFGLAIMAERAQSVDGRVEVRSSPDQGTRVTVCMPLAAEKHVVDHHTEI